MLICELYLVNLVVKLVPYKKRCALVLKTTTSVMML